MNKLNNTKSFIIGWKKVNGNYYYNHFNNYGEAFKRFEYLLSKKVVPIWIKCELPLEDKI